MCTSPIVCADARFCCVTTNTTTTTTTTTIKGGKFYLGSDEGFFPEDGEGPKRKVAVCISLHGPCMPALTCRACLPACLLCLPACLATCWYRRIALACTSLFVHSRRYVPLLCASASLPLSPSLSPFLALSLPLLLSSLCAPLSLFVRGAACGRQVSPFRIGQHEVSNARFAAFVAATKYKTEAEQFANSFVVEQFVSRKLSSST